jgi:hypothetical protein
MAFMPRLRVPVVLSLLSRSDRPVLSLPARLYYPDCFPLSWPGCPVAVVFPLFFPSFFVIFASLTFCKLFPENREYIFAKLFETDFCPIRLF